MKIDILRVGSHINGAFGIMVINEQPFCVTLERPWLNNEPMASCIPEGLYDCKRERFAGFQKAARPLNFLCGRLKTWTSSRFLFKMRKPAALFYLLAFTLCVLTAAGAYSFTRKAIEPKPALKTTLNCLTAYAGNVEVIDENTFRESGTGDLIHVVGKCFWRERK